MLPIHFQKQAQLYQPGRANMVVVEHGVWNTPGHPNQTPGMSEFFLFPDWFDIYNVVWLISR